MAKKVKKTKTKNKAKPISKVEVLKSTVKTLKKEKAQAIASSQSKIFFLANLNHDLRCPLNSILGFSQLLKEQVESNVLFKDAVCYIDNICEAANHLNSIVSRILNIAKIESGTFDLTEGTILPEKLIQLSLNIVEPLYPKRKILVVVSKKAAIITLKCDKNLSMEVLINLLENALKFSTDSIQIKCEVSRLGELVFEIIDSGVGMTKKEIAVALEPFGQNAKPLNDIHGGLGLGVPFCNQIMNLHTGTLKIKSEKGKGTAVNVVFPRSRIAN